MADALPYTDDVEVREPEEEEHIRRCIDVTHRTNALTFDRQRHGHRATHQRFALNAVEGTEMRSVDELPD